MSDFVTSFIRTVVPTLVGSLIGWLITLGVTLPEHAAQSLTAGVIALSIALYYLGARWLEQRWPAFGYLLGTRAEPIYTSPVIDVSAPPGYEAAETTVAKDLTYDVISDAYDRAGVEVDDPSLTRIGAPDEIGLADAVVERLIAEGWRPTTAATVTRREFHGRD